MPTPVRAASESFLGYLAVHAEPDGFRGGSLMLDVAILCAAAGASAAYWGTTRQLASAGLKARADTLREQQSAGQVGHPTDLPARVTLSPNGVVYYVQRGDTWWALARRFTGHGRNWPALEGASNHVPLRSGNILRFDSVKLADVSTSRLDN